MTDTLINPMLEDDDEVTTTVVNPMLEDEDERTPEVSATRFRKIQLPTRRPVEVAPEPQTVKVQEEPEEPVAVRVDPQTRKRVAPAVIKPENIGKEGYDALGRRIVPRALRRHATKKDAKKLAFIAIAGAATASTISRIEFAEKTGYQESEGVLVSAGTVTNRLWELAKMGYVDAWLVNRSFVWTITEDGIAAAQGYGYLIDDIVTPKDLNGWLPRSVQHVLAVGVAMAMFLSPVGEMREALGIEPVSLGDIVSEPHIKRGQADLEADVYRRRKAGEDVTYGAERKRLIREARENIRAGRLSWDFFMEAYPELWTTGQPSTPGSKAMGQHDPDFAIALLSARVGERSAAKCVEVEITKKSFPDYERILSTMHPELLDPVVYESYVYITTIPSLEETLRAVDAKLGLGLFDSGRLVVMTLTDRDGNPARFEQKTIGKPKTRRN